MLIKMIKKKKKKRERDREREREREREGGGGPPFVSRGESCRLRVAENHLSSATTTTTSHRTAVHSVHSTSLIVSEAFMNLEWFSYTRYCMLLSSSCISEKP